MKGTHAYIMTKIGEIKTHLEKQNHVKAYQALLDLEEEWHERNEEIEDIDVSDFFDKHDIERAKATLHEPKDRSIYPGAENIKKARLIVGYVGNE
jgi:hypothetical protein